MLKFPCLVLDHDDTVVQSEATVNYPCFCEYLAIYRPGVRYTLAQYMHDCSSMSFIDMCRSRFALTDEEMQAEYLFWKSYAQTHIPAPFDGMRSLLHRYREAGGKIFVVSMSMKEAILRDYRVHFDLEPDAVYGWDLPPECRKPNIWALKQIAKEYGFAPEQMLVVDDMKFAVEMARNAGSPIAFAGWGKRDHPQVFSEMQRLCDYTFTEPGGLEAFLFSENDAK